MVIELLFSNLYGVAIIASIKVLILITLLFSSTTLSLTYVFISVTPVLN